MNGSVHTQRLAVSLHTGGTDGLYKQSHQENYYMYRQPNLLQTHSG